MGIQNILNSNKKVTEKIGLIKEYQKEIYAKCNDALEDVVKGYKYCPECEEYYRENTFEIKAKKEMRNVCVYHSLAEIDDDIFEDRMCYIKYSVCPMGHKTEEDVIY